MRGTFFQQMTNWLFAFLIAEGTRAPNGDWPGVEEMKGRGPSYFYRPVFLLRMGRLAGGLSSLPVRLFVRPSIRRLS